MDSKQLKRRILESALIIILFVVVCYAGSKLLYWENAAFSAKEQYSALQESSLVKENDIKNAINYRDGIVNQIVVGAVCPSHPGYGAIWINRRTEQVGTTSRMVSDGVIGCEGNGTKELDLTMSIKK